MTKKEGQGPAFVRFFGPVLNALNELGGSAKRPEVCDRVAEDLKISEAQQTETNSSGMSRFMNQVGWARFYLAKGGYLDSSSRGVWTLTEKGRASMKMTHSDAVRVFREVHGNFPRRPPDQEEPVEGEAGPPSQESKAGAPAPSASYRDQVLVILRNLPPAGFERFCQRLLREAGFEQVIVTGRSGDGGIDGIGMLQVNSLVSFKVLFQCKRYRDGGSVSPGQVRDFRGAMAGRADKGLLITTATFTGEAKREAVRDGVPPIELIDGDKLVDLLEEFRLGLKPVQTFEVDEPFFGEFHA